MNTFPFLFLLLPIPTEARQDSKRKGRRSVLLSPCVEAVRKCISTMGSRVFLEPASFIGVGKMRQRSSKFRKCMSGRSSPFQGFLGTRLQRIISQLYPKTGESLSLPLSNMDSLT
jgi:hypothetical protein